MNAPGILLLFAVGVFLSAMFSGSETGFYRVTRVRLVLDGRSGDPISRGLLWLTNNPGMFVATTLIGNNLANYITARAVVLGAAGLFHSAWGELLAPIVLTPFVFVYGELLPKRMYYDAPNRLLRRSGPLFLFFGILFLPLSVLLWILARCLGWIAGESPVQVRLSLARKELQQVLKEGREAGVLQPAQHRLALGLFAVANEPVTRFCRAVERMPSVREGTRPAEVRRLARRHRAPIVLVMPKHGREPVGYVRSLDLCLNDRERIEPPRKLLRIRSSDTHIAALTRLQSESEPVALVVDAGGRPVGIVEEDRLAEPLLGRQG